MKEIIKQEVNGEIVYLKKSFDGWRVVHPLKNEDGTWNRKNLLSGGSWWNLVKIGGILLLILLAFYEWSHSLKYCSEFIANHSAMPFPQINISGYIN